MAWLTEGQIEQVVSNKTDALDRRFLAGGMLEDEYKAELAKIDQWAEWEYKITRKISNA